MKSVHKARIISRGDEQLKRPLRYSRYLYRNLSILIIEIGRGKRLDYCTNYSRWDKLAVPLAANLRESVLTVDNKGESGVIRRWAVCRIIRAPFRANLMVARDHRVVSLIGASLAFGLIGDFAMSRGICAVISSSSFRCCVRQSRCTGVWGRWL